MENEPNRIARPPATQTLIKAFQVLPKKQRGQNFLRDASTAEKLAALTGARESDAVLEIGAGLGAVTFALARQAGRVFAVEWDRRLSEILEDQARTLGVHNLEVIQGDILKVDLDAIHEKAGGPLLVFGNLPYNISSQVLFRIIEHRRFFLRALLMFQKEMAERIQAGPGGKDYGRISVAAHYTARVTPRMTLVPAQFIPRPAVDSLVLEFDFLQEAALPASMEPFFFAVVKAAFSKRRKTLKNTLEQGGLDLPQGAVLRGLKRAGIDPVRRAETLSVEEFARLTRALHQEGTAS